LSGSQQPHVKRNIDFSNDSWTDDPLLTEDERSLFKAIHNWEEKIAEQFFSYSLEEKTMIDIEAKDGEGESFLARCFSENHPNLKSLVPLLIDRMHADCDTALIAALRQGNKENVEQLLKLGADPNKPSHDNFLPLTMIARKDLNEKDAISLIKLLIKYGADVKQKNISGYTAAHVTSSIDIAKLLLEEQPDLLEEPAEESYVGYTPLLMAAEKCKLHMLRFWVRQGANINAVTTEENLDVFQVVLKQMHERKLPRVTKIFGYLISLPFSGEKILEILLQVLSIQKSSLITDVTHDMF